MEKAKALWHISPSDSQILSVDKIPSDPTLLKIKAHFSLVSSGTERLVAQGLVPDDLAESMQVPYQEGSFSFPIKYGYSLVGEVLNENHRWQGRLVHLLHPHQNICWASEAAVGLVPDGIPAQRATLTSNLETVVNAIWDAKVSVGDRVMVAGFGIIGSLLAKVLSDMPGVDLWVLEKNEKRIQLAREKGFQLWTATEKSKPFDFAFHTTGNEKALQFCLDQLGLEGSLVELSWYGKKAVQIHLGASFHSERKKIISSQVGHLPAERKARWDFQRRKEVVFTLLQDSSFDDYLHQLVEFEEVPDYFKQLRSGEAGLPGVCIAY